MVVISSVLELKDWATLINELMDRKKAGDGDSYFDKSIPNLICPNYQILNYI